MNRGLLTFSALVCLALSGCVSSPPPGSLLPPQVSSLRIADQRVQLLDVRTPAEWEEGHLKGATRIDIKEPGFTETARAKLDPARPVLVYCRSGKRSAKAAAALRKAGFTQVEEIQGGIQAWQKAGLPVTQPENKSAVRSPGAQR